MPVPYVPTAVFNTPLPPTRRGGRSARGGREGNGRGGSATHGLNGTEKLGANLIGSPSSPAHTNSSERGRIDLSSNKNQSTSSKMKRAASAGPSSLREQRKSTDPYMAERANETSVGPPRGSHVGGQSMNESRRASTATQTEDHKTRRSSTTTNQQQFPSAQTSTKASQNLVDREDGNQPISHDTHAHPKLATIDRRNEGLVKAADYAREFHGQTPSRERGEGRGDRARGGNFRNRGTGNHGFSSSSQNSGQSFPNSSAAQHQTSTQHQLPKSQLSHERHGSQSQSAPYGQSQTIPRSFRSNSRSQSIPHAVPYGRFSNGPNGPHPGPPHLSNLQTDLANTYGYQPGQQGIMSAMPYNAYMEQVSLFGMVSMQMYVNPP